MGAEAGLQPGILSIYKSNLYQTEREFAIKASFLQKFNSVLLRIQLQLVIRIKIIVTMWPAVLLLSAPLNLHLER